MGTVFESNQFFAFTFEVCYSYDKLSVFLATDLTNCVESKFHFSIVLSCIYHEVNCILEHLFSLLIENVIHRIVPKYSVCGLV